MFINSAMFWMLWTDTDLGFWLLVSNDVFETLSVLRNFRQNKSDMISNKMSQTANTNQEIFWKDLYLSTYRSQNSFKRCLAVLGKHMFFLIGVGHDGASPVVILHFVRIFSEFLTRLSYFCFSAKLSPIRSRYRWNIYLLIEIAYRINRNIGSVCAKPRDNDERNGNNMSVVT